MSTTELGPNNRSGDYDIMEPYWRMVSDIVAGAKAMRAAKSGADNPYLPKFPNESDADYAYRVANAKFTNIYRDIIETLAAKPFTKEVALAEDAPDDFKKIAEDIDGAGNHLHTFAGRSFFAGINNAVDWIMVDYVKMRPGTTLADERSMNARPYWVHVEAPRVLAVYSARIGAKEELVHVRIAETGKARDGYGETITNRVRVYNREPIVDTDGAVINYAPATFEVYEQKTSSASSGAKTSSWDLVDQGPISIGVIPMVPFIAGRRIEGTWQFVPPMQDAAYLQIEHFQQETNLKSIKEQACFPMLAGNGVAPVLEDGKAKAVPIGPKSVLYAPPNGEGEHGEWQFIEPNAESLKFLAADVEATEQQLRELGRQPLTAKTGNITVTTAAFAGDKANSVIQAWALNLKDALENAWALTAKWLGQSEGPTVVVDTDFDVGLSDEKDPDNLLKMRERGDLSGQTLGEEFKRRGILSVEWDYDEEVKRITEEIPGEPNEADGPPMEDAA
ncbi:DUF4055 domain-containing protein [Methyloceanibacter caenitepidi]|uniref:DUF4055 domain-containing protein n=1 Tax=Methyloceanibacter caenitepidi TaxID=1384459 RepID=A0A0A8K6C9_9HYPH|nr:DUF4055 domain-containing protein [Methyloceanibacter caenitepidi]BAQ18326.1 hypothetical protein GL4_2893 [Methyloceanibacter caenitepidi]